METTRQLKVARLIHKEMGNLLQKEIRNILPGKLVTVTVARITPDLALAKIYVSVFPGNQREEDIKHLNEMTKLFRLELGKKVKKQLRIVPEIRFYPDDSLDYIEKIDNLLNE